MKQLFVVSVVFICVQMLNANAVPNCPEKHKHRQDQDEVDDSWNFITNDCCPPGYAPDPNGLCREIWLTQTKFGCLEEYESESNDKCKLITRSRSARICTCPPGWQHDQNGRCREVWSFNIIDGPKTCPEGQRYSHGKCRNVY